MEVELNGGKLNGLFNYVYPNIRIPHRIKSFPMHIPYPNISHGHRREVDVVSTNFNLCDITECQWGYVGNSRVLPYRTIATSHFSFPTSTSPGGFS